MVGIGRVVGGDYLNAPVSALVGSTLVVQAGLKRHKLTPENVAEWDEVVSDGKGNVVTVVGRAVAGGALPGRFGTLASAAARATLDSLGSSHVVRVEWSDGKLSLIKLPDAMFTHLELVLKTKRAVPVEPSTPGVGSSPPERPTVGEQAFSFVSGWSKTGSRHEAGLPQPSRRWRSPTSSSS